MVSLEKCKQYLTTCISVLWYYTHTDLSISPWCQVFILLVWAEAQEVLDLFRWESSDIWIITHTQTHTHTSSRLLHLTRFTQTLMWVHIILPICSLWSGVLMGLVGCNNTLIHITIYRENTMLSSSASMGERWQAVYKCVTWYPWWVCVCEDACLLIYVVFVFFNSDCFHVWIIFSRSASVLLSLFLGWVGGESHF